MIHIFIFDYYKKITGGLTTYVGQLINGLNSENGFQVHMVHLRSKGYSGIQRDIKDRIIHHYVSFDIGLHGNSSQQGLVRYLVGETPPDSHLILHFNWNNHTQFSRFIKEELKDRCSVVLTKHIMAWRDNITVNYPLFKKLNNRLTNADPTYYYIDKELFPEQIAYSYADQIICVTQCAQLALDRLFNIPIDKTTVIYNGLENINTEKTDKQALRSKYGFNDSENIILIAGLVHQRKGVYDLVEAFDEVLLSHPNSRLLIAGDGSHSRIFKHSKQNWAKITVTGQLDKDVLFEFYQMADVGVVPSYIEQCSYSAIEMMKNGLPIIVSDVDGLAEMVSEETGLKTSMDLGDSKAILDTSKLAENIKFYLDNPEQAAKYATNAKICAEKDFSVQKMVSKTINVYRDLVGKENSYSIYEWERDSGTLPLVSIILPITEEGQYAMAAIQSVLRQTFDFFELIIVYQTLQEDVKEQICALDDNRIKIVNVTVDPKVFSLYTESVLAASKGKYIGFFCENELMHHDRLKIQVEYLEKEPDVAMVGSHLVTMNDQGNITSIKLFPVSSHEIHCLAFFNCPIHYTALLMKREVAQRLKKYSKYSDQGFHRLLFDIRQKYEIKNLPYYLTICRATNVVPSFKLKKDENLANLLSDQLNKLGVKHTIHELALQFAISQGFGRKYAKEAKKTEMLDNWLNKVLKGIQAKYHYADDIVYSIKNFVQ